MTTGPGSSTPGTVVLVGGGQASAAAAETLRSEGYDGRVVLVGAEPHLPYERPPLSKGVLAGASTPADAALHPASFYDEHEIELRLGAPATALDVRAKTLAVGDDTLGYDRLLLATGSAARRLPAADASGAPVAYLRTVEDAERIRSAIEGGGRLLVLGGGWLGLEVAAAARTAGCEVVVLEVLAEPLLRVLGPTVGRAFGSLHRRHGVDLRTGVQIGAITSNSGSGSGRAVVQLGDGTTVDGDLLVVGIGATPNLDLARTAGLDVGDGVLADEHLRTSDPDVFVAGDIAEAQHPTLGRRLRVEHWDNAQQQGALAARTALGSDDVYDKLPFFFTDQYDLGAEYVGHVGPEGADEVVVRGDLDAAVFTAFWVRDGRVTAAMHANEWDSTQHLRAVVTAGTVDLAALRDPDVPLGDLAG